MASFYEEIEEARARGDEALATYEKTCASRVERIRSSLRTILGWPDGQITLVEFDEPPDGARRAAAFGHVSRDGYHFGVKVSGPTDWHIVFYWTMHLLGSDRVELEGDPDSPRKVIALDLSDPGLAAIEPLAAYVRDKVRGFVRRFTLAALVEGTR